jgi:hypothetical protein
MMSVAASARKVLAWGKEHGPFIAATAGGMFATISVATKFKGLEDAIQEERKLRKEVEKRLEDKITTTQQMANDAVKARLFEIQNQQEYAGHRISRHPAPADTNDS